MDDQLVACPYDPLHRVKSSRIQGHIVKCEKNHPGYKICPYNATHRILPPAYKDHLLNCPARAVFFPEKLPPKVEARVAKPSACELKLYQPQNIKNIPAVEVLVDDDDDEWDD